MRDPLGGDVLATGFDPTTLLELIKAARAQFQQIGDESVRGVMTVHYRVTLPSATYGATTLVSGSSASCYPGPQMFADVDALDVWIDKSNLVHRVRKLSHVPPKSGQRVPTSIVKVVEFYDFGVAVDIQPPPTTQVGEWAYHF